MAKTWILDSETKGTGAHVAPLEDVREKAQTEPRRRQPGPGPPASAAPARKPSKPTPKVETSSTPLPPGHVRKKATGELGRVKAVDPKAGTATVQWLRQGQTSTVPLTAITRR